MLLEVLQSLAQVRSSTCIGTVQTRFDFLYPALILRPLCPAGLLNVVWDSVLFPVAAIRFLPNIRDQTMGRLRLRDDQTQGRLSRVDPVVP